jgi:hypothetical protein
MPFFDDHGNELNPDLISKPDLCVGCRKDETEDEEEQILCNLTRLDQSNEKEFVCHGFVPK